MADDTIDALRTQRRKAEEAHELARDAVEHAGAQLTSHARECKRLESKLAELDVEREATLVDHPRELEGLRTKRRGLFERRDDLLGEMVVLESHVGEAKARQVEALVSLHAATRRQCQGEGAVVSEGMRTLIGRLEKSFDMWLVLAHEDQRSKDVLLGISSNSSTIPTFSWSTALNGSLAEAIRSVIQQKDKAESELRTRERAAVAVV